MSAVTLGISMTAFGAALGAVLVPMFNSMPASWLTEVGEEPSGDVLSKPRLESTTWALPLMFATILFSKMVAKVVTVWWAAPFAALAIALLILVAVSDIKYRIVPDQLVAGIAACGVVLQAARVSLGANPWLTIGNALVGAAFAAATLMLIRRLVAKPGGTDPLGMGDFKLVFAAALLLQGSEWIVFLLLIGVFGALGTLALRRMGRIGDGTVAYAPFIAAAAIVTLIFGARLLGLLGM